jgi:hypothetical protein
MGPRPTSSVRRERSQNPLGVVEFVSYPVSSFVQLFCEDWIQNPFQTLRMAYSTLGKGEVVGSNPMGGFFRVFYTLLP